MSEKEQNNIKKNEKEKIVAKYSYKNKNWILIEKMGGNDEIIKIYWKEISQKEIIKENTNEFKDLNILEESYNSLKLENNKIMKIFNDLKNKYENIIKKNKEFQIQFNYYLHKIKDLENEKEKYIKKNKKLNILFIKIMKKSMKVMIVLMKNIIFYLHAILIQKKKEYKKYQMQIKNILNTKLCNYLKHINFINI